MKKVAVALLILALCIVVGFVWLFPDMLRLRAGISPDTYSQRAGNCDQMKQGHIAECGEGLPENDATCRTTEADALFEECMHSSDKTTVSPPVTP